MIAGKTSSNNNADSRQYLMPLFYPARTSVTQFLALLREGMNSPNIPFTDDNLEQMQ